MNNLDISEINKRMDTQNKEFDALSELIKQYNRVCQTAVVDDDYPEVRYGYESALRNFITALKENNRFSLDKLN